MTTAGTLFLVATPIGHLGDLSDRAREVLAGVELVAAEDTRRTRGLLTHLELRKRLLSLHAHNEVQRIEALARQLDAGGDVALVSDAGTPLISDPGARLVAALAERGYRVVAIPGPCAAIVALTLSGLPTDRFTFLGFPPRAANKADALIAALASDPGTLIFYESPRRAGALLARLRAHLGDRRGALCRELTKLHEEVVRGSLGELQEHAAAGLRGEVVVLVAGADERPAPQEVDEVEIQRRLEDGERMRDIGRDVAERTGLSSRAAYARVLEVKNRVSKP